MDASVLIAYIGEEPGRADTVAALLEDARQGRVKLLTSVLSVTEVAYGAEEAAGGLTAEGEAAIDKLWEPASPMTIVDVSQALTRAGRGLIRAAKQRQVSAPGSIDALHLATAVLHGCKEIFTYEKEATRTKWAAATGLPISEPYVDEPPLSF
ncbi:type II toxin-antitoxin system VapC family toxin [Iamia sp.]|uniref:type II toxin-antitoxin system VapC family toxin n=1 Tax=Iamia sp. TaxID=2722710 RepID=UPI002BE30DA0|nr:type II toxin-antitoxin system VapC family toxin [Iamia sp.]HXH58804.1 type II toxin-antitoxin system VapC family toxin [Iamia sp.]